MLSVGPVDGTDDQSSYQCILTVFNGNICNNTGIFTVLGKVLTNTVNA